jgi:hypothetical protein
MILGQEHTNTHTLGDMAVVFISASRKISGALAYHTYACASDNMLMRDAMATGNNRVLHSVINDDFAQRDFQERASRE